MNKISVTVLTKNSERYLSELLQSLEGFDEVVLYDNGSCDATFEIAAAFPHVVVHHGPFEGFGTMHNKASALARNDWILSVDSDETVTEDLKQELLSLEMEEQTVYSIPRKNFFNGKWIRWCGWHPDRQYRLYHRKHTRFTDAAVHEQIETEGCRHRKLKGSLIHYSYDSIEEFLDKMQLYSTLFAQQRKGQKSSPLKAWSRGLFAFFKSYILKRGIFGGYEGFVISAYNGHTAYYKYLKLYELNQLSAKQNREV